MSASILELENVSKHFGGIRAVSSVSVDLREGEIVALIGPNGAGKTTLVNVITGVHPASAGRIRPGMISAARGAGPPGARGQVQVRSGRRPTG